MVEIVGAVSSELERDVARFVDALEVHQWGGTIDGRLVLAENRGALEPSISASLHRWMVASEFRQWQRDQVGRPVATAGKAFIGADGVATAVVGPLPERGMLLGMIGHELVELAHLARIDGAIEPSTVQEINGTVLADEYCSDRVREEISRRLGFPESRLDEAVAIATQADDVVPVLKAMNFWVHWANLARVWAMTAGRADAGSSSAQQNMRDWAAHDLIANSGWQDVRAALQALYADAALPRAEFIARATQLVWAPIERYGREAGR